MSNTNGSNGVSNGSNGSNNGSTQQPQSGKEHKMNASKKEVQQVVWVGLKLNEKAGKQNTLIGFIAEGDQKGMVVFLKGEPKIDSTQHLIGGMYAPVEIHEVREKNMTGVLAAVYSPFDDNGRRFKIHDAIGVGGTNVAQAKLNRVQKAKELWQQHLTQAEARRQEAAQREQAKLEEAQAAEARFWETYGDEGIEFHGLIANQLWDLAFADSKAAFEDAKASLQRIKDLVQILGVEKAEEIWNMVKPEGVSFAVISASEEEPAAKPVKKGRGKRVAA